MASRLDIRTIHTFQELEAAFGDANGRTLALFDIDKVVLHSEMLKCVDHPDGKRGLDQVRNKVIDQYSQSGIKRSTLFEEALLHSITKAERVLVYPEMPEFLRRLQARGVTCIALTAWPTGQARETSVHNWNQVRIRDLENVGVTFSDCGSYVFPECVDVPQAFEREVIAELVNGMVLCGYLSKGLVLRAVLSVLGPRFDNVIFIDDIQKNIEDVAQNVGDLKFIGLHSQAHVAFEQRWPEYDPEIWERQLEEVFKDFKIP